MIQYLKNPQVAFIQSEEQLIHDGQTALELLMNCSYGGADAVIIHSHHLAPEFFNLSSGLAGEVLQKVSNYRMKLAILGDFDKLYSQSLADFIYESNQKGTVQFLPMDTDPNTIFNT